MRLTLALCRRFGRAKLRQLTEISDVTKQFANLPETYIKEMTDRVQYRTPEGKCYRKVEVKNNMIDFGTYRPWALESKMVTEKFQYVEPIRDWLFFRGDRVQVLVGKDKGKQGIISSVMPEKNWVYVEGLNMKTQFYDDDVYLREEPLLVTTQVALVDPGDLQPTTGEWAVTEEGEVVRRSTRTGRLIPFSSLRHATYDYKVREGYIDSAKDTHPDDMKATFVPKLKTFEMDIAEEHGIRDDRVPAPSFWY